MTHNIGIYLFDKVEVLDFAGPFEVFTTARRVHLRQQAEPEAAPFNVFTIGKDNGPVQARGELTILPRYNFDTHPQVNILIIPGGIVSDELENETAIKWIDKCAHSAKLTASICTGAFLLAKAGLLNGKQATTHWEDLGELRVMFPQIEVIEGTRWVDTGQIVSAAGISAGIDMSLHLVERLVSKDLAVRTARQMEFDWQDSGVYQY